MAFLVRLEKEDAEWLANLMATGIEKASRLEGGWANHIERLLAIQTALEEKDKADHQPGDKVERTRRTKEEIEAEKRQALCPDHPKNQLKKRPSTDCDGCWSAYERLEPMKYEAARRSYEASKRK